MNELDPFTAPGEEALLPARFFALRTPLLPAGALVNLSAGLGARAAVERAGDVSSALESDRAVLRERLRELFADPVAREALFVASRALSDRLPIWLSVPSSDEGRRIELTLMRYFLRMSMRATPFGLCSGVSTGTCGDSTALALHDGGTWRRHVRLDMGFLTAICEALGRQRTLRERLVYYPNSALHRSGRTLQYVEYHVDEQGRRSYQAASVERTDYLECVLFAARLGASFDAMVSVLKRDDVTLGDAAAFIHELIDAQVLVSNLEPPLTGRDPLSSVLATLEPVAAAAHVSAALRSIQRELASLNAHAIGVDTSRYEGISRAADDLPAAPEGSQLLHVDMYVNASASLGPEVLGELTRGLRLLRRLATRRATSVESPGSLTAFRAMFKARYSDREVPLAMALDDDGGLEWAPAEQVRNDSPLLNRIALPPEELGVGSPTAPDPYLLRSVVAAARDEGMEIAVSEADLEPGPGAEVAFPDSFAVLALLEARDTDAIDDDFRVHIKSITGASGSSWLGRFCHGSPQLHARLSEHLRDEERVRPEAIFAEVVHLPQGRFGNFIIRPTLRAYEIPYLGRSGLDAGQQLPLDDLLLSVVGERLVLRSRRHQKEVIPRLSTAHNGRLGYNLRIYSLLWLLQWQDSPLLAWTWGSLQALPFLPRVVSGRLVLSLARWRVEPHESQELQFDDPVERFQAAQRWRAKRRLPRYVALVEGDNELVIDLDNALCVDVMTWRLKRLGQAVLAEVFPAPDRACVRGANGRFASEVVVPFRTVRRQAESRFPALPSGGAHRPWSDKERDFAPGSEWLYLKLYLGRSAADRILQDVVLPVSEYLLENLCDSWFFLRYGDPEHHLRLRFHGVPGRLWTEGFSVLRDRLQPALDDGTIRRVQLDTYEREWDRYGGPDGVRLAERLFFADSDAVARILPLCRGPAGQETRWRLCLYACDRLLDDLGFAGDSKVEAIEYLQAPRAPKEWPPVVRRYARRQLSDAYRRMRAEIELLLEGRASARDPIVAAAGQYLDGRSRAISSVGHELRLLEASGRLGRPIQDLAGSFVHMCVNRFQRSAATRYEYVIRDFLGRYHRSFLARSRQRAGVAAQGNPVTQGCSAHGAV